MEDIYLFKAKRLDNGEWVQGNLIQSCDATDGWESIIIPVKNSNMFTKHIGHCYGNLGFENWYRVNPSTICQCTGCEDMNGKLIFENDILHNGNYFVVKWNAPCARFDIVLNNSHNIPIGKWEPMICDWETNDFKEYRKSVDYEVIGNIFDNPELLESEG